MKCSLGISNALEEISSLSHSIVLLYVFVLIAEEAILTFPLLSTKDTIYRYVGFYLILILLPKS